MRGFESWGSLVRGTLLWLGQADPVEGIEEFVSMADDGDEPVADVFEALHAAGMVQATPWTPKEVLKRAEAETNGGLNAAIKAWLPDEFGKPVTAEQLGRAFGKVRGKTLFGFRLLGTAPAKRRKVWWVVAAGGGRPRGGGACDDAAPPAASPANAPASHPVPTPTVEDDESAAQ
jgi:hypothetical protein